MLDIVRPVDISPHTLREDCSNSISHNPFTQSASALSGIMKHPSSQKEEYEFSLATAAELRCKSSTAFTDCGECETCLLANKLRELHGWFHRFGDHSKKRFMLGLLRRTKSVDLLRNLVMLLQPVLNKDGTYARARTHPSLPTDSATLSSDRAVKVDNVEYVTSSTWEWFSHSTYWTKMNFLLSMCQRCDAHLLYQLFMQAKTLLASELNIAEATEGDCCETASIKSSEYSVNTEERPDLELLSLARPDYSQIIEDPFTGEILLDKIKTCQNDAANEAHSTTASSVNTVDPLILIIPTSAKAYSGVSAHRDFIRCLPVHIAKVILSMLDMASLYNALCVSPNWRKLAEEVKHEFSVNQQIREEVLLMQGASAHGANPVYANDIDVLVPNIDPGSNEVIPSSGDVIKTTFKSEMSFETGYSGVSTKKVIMEERNIYCGAYNVMVVDDNEDANRVMHTDGSHLIAVGSKDRKVRFIDCGTGKESGPVIIGHAGSIRCCYLLQDQGKVLSGSYDTSVRCWSIETGQCLKILRGHQDTVTVIAVLGDIVATGAKDNQCKIWSLESGKCRKTFKHHAPVMAVALSEEICISGCEAGKVKVWELASGNLIKTLSGHHGPITGIKFDRWHIVTGSKDGYALGWSAIGSHSRCLAALRHPKEVLCLEFVYLRVITGSADGRIRIWNLITGQCCRIMRGNSRSDPILAMVAIGDRITVNTLNNLLVMNFEKVNWDYTLKTDHVPPLIQYGSYSDAPVRTQPYPYIRAQRMRKAGAANSKIINHDSSPQELNTQVLLQNQYRAGQIPHSAKTLSDRSLCNARRVQSRGGTYDGLPLTPTSVQSDLQRLESVSNIDKSNLSKLTSSSQHMSRSRVHSNTSQFSITIKEKKVDDEDAPKQPIQISRRTSWAFEKPLVPKDKDITLSEMKALLRSQIRMKADKIVPPDFIYLTVSTIQKSMTKSETNFNTNLNMQDLKPEYANKRPSSSPSRIDPRTKVPVEDLGLEMLLSEDGTESLVSEIRSIKTKEPPKTTSVKTKECYATDCAAAPVCLPPRSALHSSKVRSTVPRGWVLRPISAGPVASPRKEHKLVASPPRPITAPVKLSNASFSSVPPIIASSLPVVGNLLQRPKSQQIISSSRCEAAPVPMLMYPKEVKDKALELKELRTKRYGHIEYGPDGRALGKVSTHNSPLRDHVKFELRTNIQEEQQMNDIKRQHMEERLCKEREEEKRKKSAWVAMVMGKDKSRSSSDLEE
ncbi:F-box and WD repeat domain containing protein 10B-like isoform X2 [Biomphalaria glabrata]|nr:F-box and WD repeat domain containing protein 10B-like isoform X2 [Biomphalaria glabrata]